MALANLRNWRLSERDLDFLIETVSPEIRDRSGLKRIIQEDEDFRKSYSGDEKVFRRVMNEEEILLKISPPLFFEILLRRTAADLEVAGYTIERDRTLKIWAFSASDKANSCDSSSCSPTSASLLRHNQMRLGLYYILPFLSWHGRWTCAKALREVRAFLCIILLACRR